MFELFDHTADLGLRVCSETLEQLFIDAARGLAAMIVENPDQLAGQTSMTLEVEGGHERLDDWLFDWLSELLYLFETEHFVPAEIQVRMTQDDDRLLLTATVAGERLDPQAPRLRLEHEVKAITYHHLEVRHDKDGQWRATVIVDI